MKHELSIDSKRYDCEDHGCTGHTTIVLKCSCGWVKNTSTRSNSETEHIKHRLEVLEGKGL